MCKEEQVKLVAVLQKIDLTSFIVNTKFVTNIESGNSFPGID